MATIETLMDIESAIEAPFKAIVQAALGSGWTVTSRRETSEITAPGVSVLFTLGPAKEQSRYDTGAARVDEDCFSGALEIEVTSDRFANDTTAHKTAVAKVRAALLVRSGNYTSGNFPTHAVQNIMPDGSSYQTSEQLDRTALRWSLLVGIRSSVWPALNDSLYQGWADRPAEWVALPAIATGDQKLCGLLAVSNDASNYVALRCTTSAGTYTVDWGDGTTEAVASNTTAEHLYSFASLSSATQMTCGRRQAVVTITPTTANLATISLQYKHSRSGLVTALSVPWLDIAINGSSLTSIVIGGSTVTCGELRQVRIGQVGTLASCATMFQNCYSLESVPVFNTASATSFSETYSNCSKLATAPLLNTASATRVDSMYSGCRSLATIPAHNTASATRADFMAYSCSSLTYLPALTLTNCANLQNFAGLCVSLTYLPALNAAAVTSGNFATWLSSCRSISRSQVTGAKYSHSYASAKLARAQIVEIFNNLGTAAGAQSITITGNHGAADLTAGDLAIATAKGWTVVN